MTVSLWHDHGSDAEPREADVVIVGAGISGAATAWALRDTGLDVAIVDAGLPASGATGRNAGLLTSGSVDHFARQVEAHGLETALLLRRGSRDAIAAIGRVAQTFGIEADVARGGSWSVYRDAAALEAARATAAIMRQHGLDVHDAEADEVSAAVGVADTAGGLFEPFDGVADPVRLVGGLLKRSGVRVYPNEAVRRLALAPGRVEVVTTAGAIATTRVVLATNGLAAELHPWLAEHVRPVRAQMLATAPVDVTLQAPVYLTDDWAYARQRSDGRVLMGGLRHLGGPAEEVPGDALHPEIQAELEALMRRSFPALEWATVEHRWSGTMGFTTDGLPAVGRLPGAPRVFYLGGYNGHGMAWGWRLGHLAASLLLGEGEVPEALRLERFVDARAATPASP